MKKLNELKAERNALSVELKAMKVDEITEEQRSRIDEIALELETLNADIKRMELVEKTNKLEVEEAEEVEKEEREEVKPIGVEFRDWLKDAVEGRGETSFKLRAEPILTSTTTAVINKTVANSVDILTSPGEAFLRTLGVTFYPGLTGNFVVPSMAEDTATFVSEDASALAADMLPEALTLAARRVSHRQSITRETLAQTNPTIYNSIVQNLVDGVWNAITNDVFDTLQTDAASQIYTQNAADALVFGDIINMETSIGALQIGAGAYVTTPSVKGYLKQKIALGTTNGPAVWVGNELNGYPAYGVPAANANKIYFGDFSRMAVGQWGGLEIIVDPYTTAHRGKIDLTVIALTDTGCTNKRALVFSSDVSAAL